jgi:hypothetical protein
MEFMSEALTTYILGIQFALEKAPPDPKSLLRRQQPMLFSKKIK